MTDATLPSVIEDEARLEEALARPSPADVAFARTLSGDVAVVGAGGKMGPSLARRLRRALREAERPGRVLAVSRFSDPALATALAADGIEVVRADLLDPSQAEALPDAA